MQDWFSQAKLGIFIHWGIYAVDGVAESWAFHNHQMSHRDYMRQLDGFTADQWNPDAWADLFVRSGARYAVLTTKHHDGFALWDTDQLTPSLDRRWAERGLPFEPGSVGHGADSVPLSAPYRSPAKRDLIHPCLEALRKRGLKTGLYFSHLDWSHGDYASPRAADEQDANAFEFRGADRDPEAWATFRAFHLKQLEELCTRYGAIDLLWFDGDWEGSDDDWDMARLRQSLLAWQPNVLLNSRMRGHGDYQTPEQGLPIVAPDGPWEFCMTINDSWGYQGCDVNYKSPRQILRTFCDVISLGGTLLLDIGPMANGVIPEPQVETLESLGRWIAAHSEAVYATGAGLPHGHYHGPTTLSLDRKTLYLFVFGDGGGELNLKGMIPTPTRATALHSGEELPCRRLGGADWMAVPGALWIELPPNGLRPDVSVVKLEFEQPIELYRGHGQGIAQN